MFVITSDSIKVVISDCLCTKCNRRIGADTGSFAVDGQQYHSSCVLHAYLIGLGSLEPPKVIH